MTLMKFDKKSITFVGLHPIDSKGPAGQLRPGTPDEKSRAKAMAKPSPELRVENGELQLHLPGGPTAWTRTAYIIRFMHAMVPKSIPKRIALEPNSGPADITLLIPQ